MRRARRARAAPRRAALLALAGCGAGPGVGGGAATAPSPVAAPAGRTPGGAAVAVVLDGARIAGLAPAPLVDGWLWPPIVDSHVHLAYWPVGDELARRGVEVVVDLAAPEASLGAPAAVRVVPAGPMLTRPGGYPLDAWGRDGFGVGCADAASARATVGRLAAAGARVIKLALDDDGLAPAVAAAAVEAAHARGLRVAAHALTDAGAALAARLGVDLLAHTPVEPLAAATVAAWRGRAVVSTLAAFGGGAAAVANLRRLRAAGATVLYGTDLGNLREPGPSADEVALLRAAGLDDAAVAEAMTTAPLAYWGVALPLAPGGEATFLVLDEDPRVDAGALLAPRAVYARGRRLPR